ncbi:MAG: hypothetical protein ACE5IO_08160, partial [Thermoplasmata archaeon]
TRRFDGTAMGAHLTLQFERMVRLTSVTTEKPFIVDPMTYMFARERENMMKEKQREDGTTEKVLKKSYEKLAEACGKTVRKILLEEKRRILVSDFLDNGKWNEAFLEELVSRVIQLQKNLVPPDQKKLPDDIEGLMDNEELESLYKEGRLLALVPPYFYATSIRDDWYGITLRCAEKAKDYKGPHRILPLLCLSKEVLQNKDDWTSILEDLLTHEFHRVLVWFSDMKEFKEDPEVLKRLREFTSFLSEKLKVYSAYGGYFFALLHFFGVEGFSQGMCYGESKNVDKPPVPVGPPLRYYVPFLHKKVLVEDARSFYGSFPKNLCNCESCSTIRGRIEKEGLNLEEMPSDYVDRFFSLMTADDAISHFLRCREEELDDIRTRDLSEILVKMTADLEICQQNRVDDFRGFRTVHLSNWLKALEV